MVRLGADWVPGTLFLHSQSRNLVSRAIPLSEPENEQVSLVSSKEQFGSFFVSNTLML